MIKEKLPPTLKEINEEKLKMAKQEIIDRNPSLFPKEEVKKPKVETPVKKEVKKEIKKKKK